MACLWHTFCSWNYILLLYSDPDAFQLTGKLIWGLIYIFQSLQQCCHVIIFFISSWSHWSSFSEERSVYIYHVLVPEITGSKVGLTFHKKKQAFCCFDPMMVVSVEGCWGLYFVIQPDRTVKKIIFLLICIIFRLHWHLLSAEKSVFFYHI